MQTKLRVALICGGPSLERGISLNSARSVMDHIECEEIEIIPFYFDTHCKVFQISKAQLYSNTPSDFDFKLAKTAVSLTEDEFFTRLKTLDIVFLTIHGKFGEDGKIQSMLERENIPFVGSGEKSCVRAFDKFTANQIIKKHGFFTLPSILLVQGEKNHEKEVENFFALHKIKRAIVKPANGGSSIGVFSVSSPKEALQKTELIFSSYRDTRVVLEQFAEGIEFTLIILENRFGLPVALPPTEIETDYSAHQIFDFRKKYLPTRQVTWHCPPRFDDDTIERIQAQAEQLFALFNMKDFGRFDGWVLPDGNIWFCDFNPLSGMEQNSFLFQQAARIGMTHSDVLLHILKIACQRQKVKNFPKKFQKKFYEHRKKVHVLMGGDNSERQVSLMSGTNVWLKLRQSKKYHPMPFLLDAKKNVWQLPYHLCLNHTVEEIFENCKHYKKTEKRLENFEKRARLKLGLLEKKDPLEFFKPHKISFEKFLKNSPFVFIALHGGEGENGVLQNQLETLQIKFNGPHEKASRLCMDKWETSQFVKHAHLAGVFSIPGHVEESKKLLNFSEKELKKFWEYLLKKLQAKTLIVKPRSDGCTTGIVHLFSAEDLKMYLEMIRKKALAIPKKTFKGQLDLIEMPTTPSKHLLFEKFMETDSCWVKNNCLEYQYKTGLIEMTVGVLEKYKKMHVLNPSITIVEGEVLTVEEKFQGGTGINITPPPENIMNKKVLQKVKMRIGLLAGKIGLKGYARIDMFVHVKHGDIHIIEVNTLPGLTPSTVLYHQSIAEKKHIFPKKLLELLIENKGY